MEKWGKANGQVRDRSSSLENQFQYTGKTGTVLHATAGFANATYIGGGQLAKRDSVRKG